MTGGKSDVACTREAAESSWEVWDTHSGDWEMGKVWAEKREIFYQQGQWQPLDNFTCVEPADSWHCAHCISGRKVNYVTFSSCQTIYS